MNIKEILEFYELPPRLESTLLRIATRRVGELHLTSLDDVVGYIRYLITRFEEHDFGRFIRLDSPIGPDTDRTFHDIIGFDDKGLTELSEETEYEEAPKGLSIQEISSILEGKVGDEMSLLKQLVHPENGNTTINITLEELSVSIPQIQAKLGEIIHRYKVDGRLVVPKRHIASIQFNPLSIKFSPRRYHGNPLAFSQMHASYQGMSRSQIAKVDSGLYSALLKSRQLHKAIPQAFGVTYRGHESPLAYFLAHPEYRSLSKSELELVDAGLYNSLLNHNQLNSAISEDRSNLSQEEVARIVKTLSANEGRVRKTARQLGFSRTTVIKYGRMFEEIPVGRKNKLSDEEQAEVLAAYLVYRGSAMEASRHLPYSNSTIRKYWRKAGFRIMPRGGQASYVTPLIPVTS